MAKVKPDIDNSTAASHDEGGTAAPPPDTPVIVLPETLPTGEDVKTGAPIVSLTFEQLNMLIERAASAAASHRGGNGSEELRVAAAALSTLKDEVSRTVRRSNADHPHISAFSYPEGDRKRAKPKLKYETFFCGSREREEALTPEEIDLYNRFDRSKEARGGRWKAILEGNGSKTRLLVTVPAKTIDHLAEVPPLKNILTELLYGAEVVDPLRSMERLISAEAQIAALTEKLNTALEALKQSAA